MHIKDIHSESFIKALQNGDLQTIQSIPKSDLHNHSYMGSRLSNLARHYETALPFPPDRMPTFDHFIKYINDHLKPFIQTKKHYLYAMRAAFEQARDDNIVLLEMSIDCLLTKRIYPDSNELVSTLKKLHGKICPDVRFRPEIGLKRTDPVEELEAIALEFIETGYFETIDLYGHEDGGVLKHFRPIYQKAKDSGLTLKAHAGEYLPAETIRKTVEVLGVTQIQHGIRAAESKEVMQWLAENETQLNICPTSNIRLCRIQNLKTHPIRILYDHGIPVTINTDDLMIFNKSVSEEFLGLYESECMTADELDNIRLQGLKEK